MNKIIISLLVLLICSAPVVQAEANFGAGFLKISGEPAYAGGGEAFFASLNRSSLVNPGVLGFADLPVIGVGYQGGLDGSGFTALRFSQEFLGGGLGINLLHYSSGTFEQYEDYLATGYLKATDLSVSAGYGLPLDLGAMKVGVGALIKGIYGNIDLERSLGLAVDAGALLSMNLVKLYQGGKEENFTAGVSLQNIGPAIKTIEDTYGLPITLQYGAVYRAWESSFFAVDVAFSGHNYLGDGYSYYSIGAEISIQEIFVVRAGYKLSQVNDSPVSFGVGMKNDSGRMAYSVDFCYAIHKVNNMVGFGLVFEL